MHVAIAPPPWPCPGPSLALVSVAAILDMLVALGLALARLGLLGHLAVVDASILPGSRSSRCRSPGVAAVASILRGSLGDLPPLLVHCFAFAVYVSFACAFALLLYWLGLRLLMFYFLLVECIRCVHVVFNYM